MSSNSINISVRWKWLLSGLAAATLTGLLTWFLHDWQVVRMAERIHAEARSAASNGDVETSRAQYEVCVQLAPRNPNVLEEYGIVVLQDEDTLQNRLMAFNLLDTAILCGSKSIETRLQFFKTAARLQQFSVALHVIDGIDIPHEDAAELYTLKGRCLHQKGSLHEAKTQLQLALRADPKFPAAWQGLVEVARSSEGDNAALAIAEKMEAVVPGTESLAVKAACLEKSLMIKEAGRTYWAAARQNPGDHQTAAKLADFVMRSVPPDHTMDLNMIQSAFDLLLTATETMDYMSAARLADLAHRLNKNKIALEHYSRCLEFRPQDEFALGRITELLIAQREFEQAHETLDRLPHDRSVALLSHTLRGRILLAEGRTEEAVVTLEEALRQSGDARLLQGAYITLIEALHDLEQYNQAVVVARELMFVSGESDDARELYVDSLAHAGEFDTAVHQLTQFDSPEEYLSPLMLRLTNIAEASDRVDELERYIESARFHRANSSIPNLHKAYRLRRNGRAADAVFMLAELANQFPENPEYDATRRDVIRDFSERLNAVGVDSMSDISSTDERIIYGLEIAENLPVQDAAARFVQYLRSQHHSEGAINAVTEILRQLELCPNQTEKTAALSSRLAPHLNDSSM